MSSVSRRIAETPPRSPQEAWSKETGIRFRSSDGSCSDDCPIDKDLQTVILKSLAKEHKRRYKSAVDLAGDVRRYLAGDAIEARGDSIEYKLRVLCRKYPLRAVAVIAIVIVVLLAMYIPENTAAKGVSWVFGTFGAVKFVQPLLKAGGAKIVLALFTGVGVGAAALTRRLLRRKRPAQSSSAKE